MSSTPPSEAVQPKKAPTTLVGCLLDVSGSMRQALETGKGDGQAIERLHAVLRAALQLARAEQKENPNALMFIGAFGLDNECTPVVDLCRLVDELLIDGLPGNQTGHELLIELANRNNVAHVTEYIKTKLTDHEARTVHIYLQSHRTKIQEFVKAIPSPMNMTAMEITADGAKAKVTSLATGIECLIGDSVGSFVKRTCHARVDIACNKVVENSEALKIARQICREWLEEFENFNPQPVSNIIAVLERLQDHPTFDNSRKEGGRTLLDDIRPRLYGRTPMRAAMEKVSDIFTLEKYEEINQRMLVMISDGMSTDGDPISIAKEMKEEKITIVTIFLTHDNTIAHRQLHDHAPSDWHNGRKTLLDMASKVEGTAHPIPVLASMGWKIPSSGECALHATVCSSNILEEFCSLLLSARFGSADVLLDILGRVDLDTYIDDEHIQTRNNPSDQEDSGTCYAHAAAAVIHMALLRIVDREGGFPSVTKIRKEILQKLPKTPKGRTAKEVLDVVIELYRPLRYRRVDEDGARQAVLHRRPVLATFCLSSEGWKAFSQHFENSGTCGSVLTPADMAPHSSLPSDGGHAVVLVRCAPESLTFLNSWGNDWGQNGSFSIENPTVLELQSPQHRVPMSFYDIFWYETELTSKERKAYMRKVDEKIQAHAKQYRSIFELEAHCPHCRENSAIAKFIGDIRKAKCPKCRKSFAPEPGCLLQALYIKAGLRNVI